MAYGNSAGGKNQFLQIGLGLTFGDHKAYQLYICKNNKVRLEIYNPTVNADGSNSWDFIRGKVGVSLNWNDFTKLYLASRELVRIHTIAKSGKVDLTDPKNVVYTTKIIRIPLVAQVNGQVYGDISIGLMPDPKTPNEETFYVAFQTTGRDKNQQGIREMFVFEKSNGQNGIFEYSNGKEKIHESYAVHLGVTEFVQTLDSIIHYGKLIFGYYITKAFRPSGGSSGGGGNSGGYHGGGNSGGYTAPSSGDDDAAGDIPF
jgi:hypothetical protein